jgi:16S rRNA processing protein RimM
MPAGRSWVEFGTLSRPHGVRGEVRLVPIHPDALLPETVKVLRVCPRGGAPALFNVRASRAVHEAVLVTFEGIEDRDAAQALAGARVEIDAADLPPLAPGEFYLYELQGAKAVSLEGKPLGVIEGLLDNRGQDLLVLASDAGERLLPLLDNTLVRFDRTAHCAVLRVPDGLWE